MHQQKQMVTIRNPAKTEIDKEEYRADSGHTNTKTDKHTNILIKVQLVS